MVGQTQRPPYEGEKHMPVTWRWKYLKGYYTLKQQDKVPTGEVDILTSNPTYKTVTNTFKINIYSGNCLGVLIHETKGSTEYTFQGFWSDFTHIKNLLGMRHRAVYKSSYYSKKDNPTCYISKIYLNVYYKRMIRLAALFAKSGIKVVLYYKEPKREKGDHHE